ncbi:MAG: T9SS type A sorting domain-containing protein [Bacteroidota bacterium]
MFFRFGQFVRNRKSKPLILFASLCSIALLSLFPTFMHGQWRANGVAVCDTSVNSGFYMIPQIASDDSGGAYVCWRDVRNGNSDIYAQRIGPDGRTLWPKNGIPIVDDTGHQAFPRIISDGYGGAYVAWEDSRSLTSTHIYSQRINRYGESLWQVNGVRVAEVGGLFISLADDKRGGLLIAWNSFVGDSSDVHVQRLDSLGNRVWPDSGVRISNRPAFVSANDVAVIEDGRGGGFVAWSEGESTYEKVYTQRIDSVGKVLWSANGIEISDSVRSLHPVVSSDLNGGIIISWASLSRIPGSNDAFIFAQRICQNGEIRWAGGGILIGDARGGGARRHTPDNQGGVFIGHSRWIQHLDSSGTKAWPDEGAQFTDASTGFSESHQVRHPDGGIWNFWTDFATGTGTDPDIYAQRISITGIPLLGLRGKPLCDAGGIQQNPRAVSDGRGGAIVVWDDLRNSDYSAVYAGKIDSAGLITTVKDGNNGHAIPEGPYLHQNYPNPFNPETHIAFSLPQRTHVKLNVRNILGQEIVTLIDDTKDSGNHELLFRGEDLTSGVYFYRLVAGNSVITRKMLLIR